MIVRHLDLYQDKWVVASLACIFVSIFLQGFTYQMFCSSILIGAVAAVSCVGSSVFEFFTFGKNLLLEAFLTGCLTIMADMFVNNVLYEKTLHSDATSIMIGITASIIYLMAEYIKAKL